MQRSRVLRREGHRHRTLHRREGNYFKPAKFEAHRGDLLRFTPKAGVHNVHFLAVSNPGEK